MSVCLCVCVCVCVYVCVRVYIYMYIVAPIYISYMSVCLCVRVSVCLPLSVYVCVCTYIHIYVYIAGGIAGRTSGHKHGVEVDYKILGGRRRLRARNGALDRQGVLLAPHVACRAV